MFLVICVQLVGSGCWLDAMSQCTIKMDGNTHDGMDHCCLANIPRTAAMGIHGGVLLSR